MNYMLLQLQQPKKQKNQLFLLIYYEVDFFCLLHN